MSTTYVRASAHVLGGFTFDYGDAEEKFDLASISDLEVEEEEPCIYTAVATRIPMVHHVKAQPVAINRTSFYNGSSSSSAASAISSRHPCHSMRGSISSTLSVPNRPMSRSISSSVSTSHTPRSSIDSRGRLDPRDMTTGSESDRHSMISSRTSADESGSVPGLEHDTEQQPSPPYEQEPQPFPMPLNLKEIDIGTSVADDDIITTTDNLELDLEKHSSRSALSLGAKLRHTAESSSSSTTGALRRLPWENPHVTPSPYITIPVLATDLEDLDVVDMQEELEPIEPSSDVPKVSTDTLSRPATATTTASNSNITANSSSLSRRMTRLFRARPTKPNSITATTIRKSRPLTHIPTPNIKVSLNLKLDHTSGKHRYRMVRIPRDEYFAYWARDVVTGKYVGTEAPEGEGLRRLREGLKKQGGGAAGGMSLLESRIM